MPAEKRYEILHALPSYGPMYIPISADGKPFYSEGFVVRFFKTDGEEWVANFKTGWTSLNKVIEFENSKQLLVIAGGTCYFMDPNIAKPIEVFGVGYSAIFKANKGRIILQDQTDLTIVEADGTHWHTERISLDGLAEIKVENNCVFGLASDPMHQAGLQWVEFQYDLDTKILIGGSFNSHNFK